MKYVKRSGSCNIGSVVGRIDQPRVVLTTTSSSGMVGPPRGSCSLTAPAAHPLPQVHRSSEPWTHTLARVCGDSRAAVNHNSTMCESARAQVRPKITSSYHCLEESRFAIQNLQSVRLQSETTVLCVRCVCGWLQRRRRSAHATPARLEFEGDESQPSVMPRSAADATVQPSCLFGVIAFCVRTCGVSGCRRLTRAAARHRTARVDLM